MSESTTRRAARPSDRLPPRAGGDRAGEKGDREQDQRHGGIEEGGREILVGVLILAVSLYGAVAPPERLAGYIILLLGGLASAALPVV